MRRILSTFAVLAAVAPAARADVLPPLSAVFAIDPTATSASAPLTVVGRDGQRTVLGIIDPTHHTFTSVVAGLNSSGTAYAARSATAPLTVFDLNTAPLDGTYLSAGPAQMSYCQVIGCNAGHSYASLLTMMHTVGDGTRQEIAHAIDVTDDHGYQANADAINNGVEGLFVGARGKAGGAQLWGGAFDLVLDAGYAPNFAAILELDVTNNAYDAVPGQKNVFGLYVGGFVGAYPGNTALFVGPLQTPGSGAYAWHNGLSFCCENAVKDYTFLDNTYSITSIEIAGSHSSGAISENSVGPAALVVNGQHSIAGIADQSTSEPAALSSGGSKTIADIVAGANAPHALQINGPKSSSSIEDTSTSPAAFNPHGSYSIASIVDVATAPAAISMGGKYSLAQIFGTNFKVDPSGYTFVAGLTSNTLAGPGGQAVCASANGSLYTHAPGGC